MQNKGMLMTRTEVRRWLHSHDVKGARLPKGDRVLYIAEPPPLSRVWKIEPVGNDFLVAPYESEVK